VSFDPTSDYPPGSRRRDLVRRTTLLHARETAEVEPGAAPVELKIA